MTVYHNFTWMYLNMSKLLVVIIDRIHKKVSLKPCNIWPSFSWKMMQLQMCNCVHNNCYFLPLKFTYEIWYVIFFFLIRFNFFSDGPFKKLCGSNTHIQFGGSWLSTTIQRVYVTLWVGALTSSKLTLIGVK